MSHVKFKKIKDNAVIPIKKDGDAGYDLCAVEAVTISPFERKIILTGLQIEIPVGFYGRIAPRSGLAVKSGIDVMAGVVDCFSAESFIKTLDGDKKVSDLKIGEGVFSIEGESFRVEKDKIVAIVDTGEQEIIKFETEVGVLEVTGGTLVYTKSGVKKAKNVLENDFFISL